MSVQRASNVIFNNYLKYCTNIGHFFFSTHHALCIAFIAIPKANHFRIANKKNCQPIESCQRATVPWVGDVGQHPATAFVGGHFIERLALLAGVADTVEYIYTSGSSSRVKNVHVHRLMKKTVGKYLLLEN